MVDQTIEHILDFARQQMAAEAFLSRGDDSLPNRPPTDKLRDRLEVGNTHASKFMPIQAEQFVGDFEVLAQYRNDPLNPNGTGFSGTLFRNRETGELTLSFRSTEFIDDTIRDSKSTNDLEVRQLGWAFGQISEMEKWYRELRADPQLLGGKDFYVTGYSLGGHLATAFNILRQEEAAAGTAANPIKGTYTFNGAGVGDLKPGKTLGEVIANFERYRDDPDLTHSAAWAALTVEERDQLLGEATSRANAIAAEQTRVAGLSGVAYALNAPGAPAGEQATVQYQLAALLAARDTVPIASFPFFNGVNDVPSKPVFADEVGRQLIATMTEIVGSDGGKLGPSFVSNSGIHYGARQEVYIEDQPLVRGTYSIVLDHGLLVSNPSENDFADTHSLVLLVDSLSLMAAFEALDPAFSVEDAGLIFATASSATASTLAGTQGKAEGDVLERTLDALRTLLLGPGSGPKLDYAATLEGNTWHAEELREPFHKALGEVNTRIRELANEGTHALRVEVLVGRSFEELVSLAGEEGEDGKAYRYALRNLNPFAVLGYDYAAHDESHELDLFDPETGTGLTEQWIEARASLLDARMRFNGANGALSPEEIGAYFEDQGLGTSFGPLAGPFARFVFAADDDPVKVLGLSRDDMLFGGASADEILGGFGNDYLEGGAGADRLDGGGGADILDGVDGAPGDRLAGGSGYDIFYADWGDSVADDPENPRGGIVYVGPERIQLGDAYRTGSSGFFAGAGGLRYWEGSDGRIVTYLPGDGGGQVAIEAPLAGVPGRESLSGTVVSGRPDLGIRLVSEVEDRPQPAPLSANDAVPSLWALAQTWHPFADPLALDIDGDGIETLGGPPGRAVLFDHTGDGTRDGTGWLAPDDAWLALDRDGDGLVTRGGELFGVDTLLPNGTKAPDGFAALAPLDTTGDGVIDAADAQFRDLLVWRDANSNGLSEPFELQGLGEAGIVEIRLEAESVGDPLPGGNTLIQGGAFRRADGTAGLAASLNLVRETYYRDFAAAPASAGGDLSLPDVSGSGRVRDLEEASAESAAVAEALAAAASAASRTEQRARVDALLTAWAENSAMASGADAALGHADRPLLYYYFSDLPAPGARDVYTSLTGSVPTDPASLPEDWYVASQSDAYRERIRKLETLERFTGRTFVDVANAPSVVELSSGPYQLRTISVSIAPGNWQYVEEAYAALEDSVYLALAAQTRLAPYVDAFVHGQGSRDFSEIEGMFAARRATDPIAALGDLYDLSRALGIELVDRGWITLPSLLAQWAGELSADPALAPSVAALGIRFRDNYQVYGGSTSDVILGSDWVPPPAPLPGVRSTYGGYGDDLLFGGEPRETDIHDGAGRDIVQGGPEFDYLYSGPGRDIYLFGRGSGTDLLQADSFLAVTDLDRDVLQFLPGVAPSDVVARRVHEPGVGSYSLELSIAGTGDAFVDKYFFHPDGSGNLLSSVRFADGTVWNPQDIRIQANLGTERSDNGTPGNGRLLMGSPWNDSIDGRGGDDTLLADAGDDLLLGGSGLDTLEGDLGDDVLDGGPGHDWLYGGFGVDTYVLARGGGTDEIFRGNFITFAGTDVHPELDVVRVAEGIAPDEVVLQRQRSSLRIALADGSAEMIDYGNPRNPLYAGENAAPSIGRIEFSDGTVWDGAEIRARSLLGATAGDDVLYGFDGGGDALAGLGGADQLFGLGGADQLAGGDGDDILEGGEGNDLLDGGAGDDRIYGGLGTDTFLLRRAGGRDEIYSYNFDQSSGSGISADLDVVRVEAGIAPGEIALERLGSQLHVTLADGSAELVDYGNSLNARYAASGAIGPGIDRIEFADGTAWDGAEIRARTAFGATDGDDVIVGFTDSGDVLEGLDGDDYLDGQGGDDLLDGGPGDDTLAGGAGADTYVFGPGDGHDTLYDSADDVNALRLRDVAPGQIYLRGSVLELANSGDTLQLMSVEAIQQVEFPDGSTVALGDLPASAQIPPPQDGGAGGDPPPPSGLPFGLPDLYGVGEATAGDDLIFGTDAPETIGGGPGTDILVGRRGSDTYLFDLGDGVDLIVDEADEDGPNVVQFGPGIAPGDLQIQPADGVILIQVDETEGVAVWGGMPELRFAGAPPSGSEGSLPGADDVTPSPPQTIDVPAGQPEAGLAETTGDDTVPTAPRFRPTPDLHGGPDAAGGIDRESIAVDSVTGVVGVPADPLYREMERQLDMLLHVGRPNLGERYAEAVREFEKRRRQREEPPSPPPSEEEVEAWNGAMHAWHEENPGYAETDLGPADGAWTPGWGIGGDGSLRPGGANDVGELPGLANPRALPRFPGAAPAPGLNEGIRFLR